MAKTKHSQNQDLQDEKMNRITENKSSKSANAENSASDKWGIPSDWEVKHFEDVADIDKESLKGNTSKDYEFDYISLSDVDSDDFKIEATRQVFGNAPSRARRIVKKGDILMSTVRPNLQGFSLIRNDVKDLIASTGFAVITAKECSNEYLFQFLFSSGIERQFYQLLVGSNYPAINSSDVRKLKIPLPPLPEQTAIAQLLSTWDNAITKTQALIAQKEERKKWLMQNLLTGKMRLKINDELKIDNGELNNRSLTDLILGELGKIVSGGTPSTTDEKFWDGKINWVTPTEITGLKGEKYLFKTKRKITEAGLKNSSAEIIPENSILITTRATIGELAINKVPVTTNQGFKSIIPDLSKINTEYLFYLLQTQKQQLKSFATGSTFFEISKADIINFPLSIINSLSEQTAIAQVLQAADKEIQLLKTKCNKLKEQKKGLMQVLLTGKKRLII
jgi:type I restriction enzyme S subunit